MHEWLCGFCQDGGLKKYFLIQPDNIFWHRWNARAFPIFSINSLSKTDIIQDPKAYDSTFINIIQLHLCPNAQKKFQKW